LLRRCRYGRSTAIGAMAVGFLLMVNLMVMACDFHWRRGNRDDP
jgi:hypothetical protein